VSVGKPALGGEWTLTDHHGDLRDSKDFLGQWLILYFGFSFCPDICPEEMEKLVEAVDRIGKNIPHSNVLQQPQPRVGSFSFILDDINSHLRQRDSSMVEHWTRNDENLSSYPSHGVLSL